MSFHKSSLVLCRRRDGDRSVRSAGLGRAPLSGGYVTVQVAVLPFAEAAVEDVLNVLHYQVDRDCKNESNGSYIFFFLLHSLKNESKHSPRLSAPRGMMTSAYFFVF